MRCKANKMPDLVNVPEKRGRLNNNLPSKPQSPCYQTKRNASFEWFLYFIWKKDHSSRYYHIYK